MTDTNFIFETNFSRSYQIFVPGGGRGPRVLENYLLNKTPNLISGTTLADSGGHSGGIKKRGYPAAGDTVSRMEIHVRNALTRILFSRTSKDEPIYGNRRLMTDMIAALARNPAVGSFSNAVKFMERELKHYFGRVVPLTNTNMNIRIYFSNGDKRIGEHNIDQMTRDQAPVLKVEFVEDNFPLNGEYTHLIRTAHGIVIPPGTTFGSLDPALMREEVVKAINESGVPIILMGNSVNHLETLGWTMEDHIKHFTNDLGIEITHAIFPRILFDMPPLYKERGWDRIVPQDKKAALVQKKACEKYVEFVEIRDDLTTLVPYEDAEGKREVIEHVGLVAANRVIEILDEHYERPQYGQKKTNLA